ncbi:zinc-binding protein A33-like isoform X2 [Engystomops pustulosus]|uniref:zinc-binding protein A33-like isoform X2 n=1 Tax=Engystomops pustulosus TaxID=76066 RepID=UPI003AFACAE7
MACGTIENLSDGLSCPLCHHIFKDPVTLQSCGHNFCHTCLQRQQKSGVREGQDKTCPVCKKICPAHLCIPNITMSDLVGRIKENREDIRQMLKASQDFSDQLACSLCCERFRDPVSLQTCGHSFCHECLQKKARSTNQGGTLCPTCNQACPKKSYVHDHVLGSLVKRINRPGNRDQEQGREEGQEQKLVHECDKHKERISLFCLYDQTLCCLVCRDSFQHEQHKFLPLAEASDLIKVVVYVNVQKQLMLMNKVTNMSDDQEERMTEHKTNKVQVSEHITKEFEKLHKFLEDAKSDQLQQLDVTYDPLLKKMEENKETLRKKQKLLETNLEECQKKLVDSDIGALQDIREFLSQHCKTGQIEENLTVIKEKPETGLFKGPFQYYTWKRMLSVLQPAAPLVLDPQTANWDVLLSKDLTSLSYRQNIFTLFSERRSLHFHVALTTECFSDGRHYFEVDVDGKKEWIVGLAKDTVERKRDAIIDDIYCSIFRNSHGELFISDSVVVSVACVTLKRVGMYLDYTGGQVSFYNAEKMTHLHSLSANFTGELCPYIGTSGLEEVPIKIVHLRL